MKHGLQNKFSLRLNPSIVFAITTLALFSSSFFLIVDVPCEVEDLYAHTLIRSPQEVTTEWRNGFGKKVDTRIDKSQATRINSEGYDVSSSLRPIQRQGRTNVSKSSSLCNALCWEIEDDLSASNISRFLFEVHLHFYSNFLKVHRHHKK